MHVWRCRVDALSAERVEVLTEAWCGADERAAAARPRSSVERRRRRLAHLLARRALRLRTGVPERELRVAVDDRGRPRLAGPEGADVDFNLSHGEAWVAVATAAGGARVGVDIESLSALGDPDALAGAFAAEERRALDRLEADCRPRAALRLWTLKEAWVKADGTDQRLPLDRFALALDPAGGAVPVRVPPGERAADWTRAERRPDADTALAVAVRASAPVAWRFYPAGFP